MTDETKGGEQPEVKTLDLDTLFDRLNAENDKRFQGFQSILDRRSQELRDELDSLKSANLTPEEQEQAEANKLKVENENLKRKNQILSMRKEHPEEVDLLESFLDAGSLQEQLTLLSKFRKAQAPAVPEGEQPEAAEGGEPTPVDKNNPARPSQPSLEAAAERMNADMAKQILESSGQDKGILSRLRRG
jgi:hypothetical protein